MDLQTVFYVMGIVFMSLMIAIMIAMVLVVFYIKRKIDRIQQDIEDKINMLFKPADIAVEVGSQVIQKARKLLANRGK